MNNQRNTVLGCAVFIFLLLILQNFSTALELDRHHVLSGEVWRIWTSHFVHSNMPHLLLNMMAALFIYFSFFTKISLTELLVCSLTFSALISIALLFFLPDLDWYNGLSGLLHALVAYFSIRIAVKTKVYWIGASLVWIKVLTEATMNFSDTYFINDMNVITEAHLIGAFIGSLFAIISIVLSHLGVTLSRPN